MSKGFRPFPDRNNGRPGWIKGYNRTNNNQYQRKDRLAPMSRYTRNFYHLNSSKTGRHCKLESTNLRNRLKKLTVPTIIMIIEVIPTDNPRTISRLRPDDILAISYRLHSHVLIRDSLNELVPSNRIYFQLT